VKSPFFWGRALVVVCAVLFVIAGLTGRLS